jgi:integrase
MARGYGDGVIDWREAKQGYYARIFVGTDENGKKKRLSKSFGLREYGTKREARQAAETWVLEQREAKAKGKLGSSHKYTLREFADRYTESRKSTWKRRHHHTFRYILESHIYPVLADILIRELSPMMINDWVTGLAATEAAKGNSGYQAWRAHHCLKMVLKQAVDLELIDRNPATKIKVVKPKTAPKTFWSRGEVAKVMRFLRGKSHPLAEYVHIALTTGMRREELLGLPWKRVNLEELYLDVQEVCVYVSGKWHIDDMPKSANALRRIYFDVGTAEALRKQHARTELLKSVSNDWEELGLVFTSARGTPLQESRLIRAFKQICIDAGVTPIRLYDLRATWTNLSYEKVPERIAVARSGHSASVRQQHYVRVLDSELRTAALSLEELIN